MKKRKNKNKKEQGKRTGYGKMKTPKTSAQNGQQQLLQQGFHTQPSETQPLQSFWQISPAFADIIRIRNILEKKKKNKNKLET